MEDIDVVKLVKNGDTEAFSILVEKYHRLSFSRFPGEEKQPK